MIPGNRTPLLRFLLLLMSGILAGIYFPVIHMRAAILATSVMMLHFFVQFIFRKKIAKYQRRWVSGIVSYTAVLFTGYLITVLANQKNNPAHFRNFQGEKFIGYLDQPVSEKEAVCRTYIRVKYILDNFNWVPVEGKCLVYFRKDPASSLLKYGDLITWQGKPSEVSLPPNPAQFNFKRWLEFDKVYDQLFLAEGKWKLLGSGYGMKLYAFAYALRDRMMQIFRDNHIDGQDYAVISALILGYDDLIAQDVISAYAASGTLHVLSVSGLHVGIIFVAISRLLGFLNRTRLSRITRSVIIILFLWFYALLTGLSPSVLRSATMLSFIIVGRMTRQHISLFNTLAASAFFLLLFDPFMIMKVGFQLSYLAVLGIVFLQPRIESLANPKGWLLRNCWSITSVSLAAQLATFPVGLYYFHQFPVYFIFSNLLIIPVSTVIIYGGILLLLASGWASGSAMIGFAVGYLVRTMNTLALFIGKLPVSSIGGISITLYETFLLYLFITTIAAFLNQKRSEYLLIGVVSLLMLMTSQLLESIRFLNQEKLVVYSIRGKSTLNIIHQKRNFLFADSALVGDRQQMAYNIYQYWWQCGLDESSPELATGKSFDSEQFCYYRGFLQYRNLRIGFFNSEDSMPFCSVRPKLDLLVLTDGLKTKFNFVKEHFDFRILVIDSSVPFGKTKKWLKEAGDAGVAAYSVLKDGAFVYDLSGK